MKRNYTLYQLVDKKKQMLESFLVYSSKLVLNSDDKETQFILVKRKQLIQVLKRVDKAIMIQEQQCQKNAQEQFPEIYKEISQLLYSILENNQVAIHQTEDARKEVEQELKIFDQGRIASAGYLKQLSSVSA